MVDGCLAGAVVYMGHARTLNEFYIFFRFYGVCLTRAHTIFTMTPIPVKISRLRLQVLLEAGSSARFTEDHACAFARRALQRVPPGEPQYAVVVELSL